MSGISLTLFGTPTVHRADALDPAPLGAKATALLAYLALEAGSHGREKLASLLWGESPEPQARASLRQALRQLHSVLGDDLVADRATVRLADPPDSDVANFLALATQGSAAAAEFPVPRFLEGLSVTGAPALEEWADATRRSLLDRWAGTLRSIARDAVQRSRWREALGAGEAWLKADQLNEEAMAVVMESLHCLGDRAGALSRFRHFREHLRQEVGARPTSVLTSLAAKIEDSAPEGSGNGSPHPTFVADLQGRESQWLALTARWDDTAAGHGGAVIVEGEDGVGKTRLAEEFTRWAGGRGATVLRGHGYEPSSGAAFGPLMSALSTALNAPGLAGTPPEWLAEVARLLPELRRRFPGMPDPAESSMGDRPRLFEGIAQVLMALAAERPTVVYLDDLHWCDAESCALILYLVERLSASPALFLFAATTGNRRRQDPADHLLRQLSARCHAEVIGLGALSEQDVWMVLRQMGNIRTPAGGRRFAHRIHEVTGGNPFYVVELLKTLFSQDLLSLSPVSGEWVVPADLNASDFAALPMPRSVRDAIADRVAVLDEEAGSILATLAVAARPVTLDVLAHVHGMSRLRLAHIIDNLIERHLAAEEDGQYCLTHALLAEVVRGSLTDALRVELHRVLSRSIEIVSPEELAGAAAGAIAWHADRAGEPARAHDFALIAAEHAAGQSAFQEAVSWLGLAARAVPAEEAQLRERAAELAQRAHWPETPPFPPGAERQHGFAETDLDLRVER